MSRVQNLHGKEGVDGSSPSGGSKIPAKRRFLLSDLVQPSTSFARRGSRVNLGSTRQRVAGNHQRFLGAPAALGSWGQVLGTNDGWLGPNGRRRACTRRVIDREKQNLCPRFNSS